MQNVIIRKASDVNIVGYRMSLFEVGEGRPRILALAPAILLFSLAP
jgi:hypothetical protein